MAGIGNTGASALLRSASSLASAKADYTDKLAALQWSNSSKTEADWQQYSSYLSDRIDSLQSSSSLSNQSKALSITSTLQSAQKSFISSTVQRNSIDILEGNGTLQDKANSVAQFYQVAASNGDDSLAQSLRAQFDSIDQQIQYQATEQNTLAQQMAARGVTTVKAYVNTLQQDLDQFSRQFSDFGAKGLDTLSKSYASSLKNVGIDIPGGKSPGVWDIAGGVVSNLLNALQVGINQYGPVDGAALVEQYNNIVNGQTTFNVGGLKLNYNQLNDAQLAANAGQQYASPVDKGGKTVLVANKEQAYMWGKDPTTGQFKLVTSYTPAGADLAHSGTYRQDSSGNYVNASGAVIAKKTPTGQYVDKNGKPFTDEATMNKTLSQAEYSYQDVLKNAGFNVRSDNGGLYVSSTDKTSSFFNAQGLEPGEEFQVLKGGNDGQLRFVAPPDAGGNRNLYGLSFNGNGSFSSLFQVNPLSDTQSGFAGTLSPAQLTTASQLRQTQALQVAKLQQPVLPTVAQLKLSSAVSPNVQAASTLPLAQPAAPVQALQPAATAKAVQATAGPSVIQPAAPSGPQINQSGQISGITLKQPVIKTIPL